MKPLVTHARLLEILDYNGGTGQFTWKVRIGGRSKVGAVAGSNITVRSTCTYRHIRIDGRNYYAHVLARFYVTGEWPVWQVGHKDLDGLNNRYLNLCLTNHPV